jgi:hypothetical protein
MRNDPHIGELLKEHIPPAVTFSPLLGTVILERISTLQETDTLFEKDGELSFLINEPDFKTLLP